MPLSSAERFRIYKAKLKLEENKSLLEKFREKDAAAHRKSRQENKNNPDKTAKIREQNRKRQAKRRSKLAAEKKQRSELSQSCSSTNVSPLESSYKCAQTLAKAVHRSERGLPSSPTKKKLIIEHLAVKHGVIPKPSFQSAPNSLSDLTKNRVFQFYELNEISSVAPGKKDIVFVKLNDGSRVPFQKRYLIMTVREAYEQFKLLFPDEKLGATSFSLLRPKHVLPMCDIPQNVCLCKYHTNMDLLLSILNSTLDTPKTTRQLRESVVCDSNSHVCMSLLCENCGDLNRFDDLFKFDDGTYEKTLNYFQWETVESRIVKTEKTDTIRNIINELKRQTPTFLIHSFITHVQYMHFEECKQNASSSSIVLQVDFSENYRTAYQNEIQNAFFNYNQVGLFSAVVWSGSDTEPISYALVSDDVSHDRYSIHVCLTEIILDLKKRFPVLKTINIFSDGASSQFKQRFSFTNLTFLSMDHNIELIWNFFSSGHGRGAVDGVGGTLKRLVWKGVLANQCVVRNAQDFAHYAKATVKHINTILIDSQYIKSQSSSLDKKWLKVRPVPQTLKIHYVKPVSLYNIEIKPFAKSNDIKTFCLKP